MTYNIEFKIKAVEKYIENGSYRKTASELGINFKTLYKWVKKFGKGELVRRSPKRKSKEIEEKVYILKEKNPEITLREAKEKLEKESIKISLKGIWAIWKRYGLTGYRKDVIGNNFLYYHEWAKESKQKYEIALNLFNKNKIKECAKILNSIPFIPDSDTILKDIPDEYLNIRRKAEKYLILFGKLPPSEYIQKLDEIEKELKKRGMNFTLIRVILKKISVYKWMNLPFKMEKEIKKLKKLIKKRNYSIFPEIITKDTETAFYFAFKGDKKRAIELANNSMRNLKNKKIVPVYLMFDIAVLFLLLSENKKARKILEFLYDRVRPETKIFILSHLFKFYLSNLEFKKIREKLKEFKSEIWGFKTFYNLFMANYYFVKGKFYKSINFAFKTVEVSKKEEITKGLLSSLSLLLLIYSLLKEENKKKEIIEEFYKISLNSGLKKEIEFIRIIKNENLEFDKLSPENQILYLLREGKVKTAYRLSEKRELKLSFIKSVILFPETVNKLNYDIKKKILNNALLLSPLFNMKIHKIYIKLFDNNKIIFKNKTVTNLTLKEKSFLIHFGSKAKKPKTYIKADKFLENFFFRTKNKIHALRRIVKNINTKIFNYPAIVIKKRYKEYYLFNNSVYFIFDYDYLTEKIKKAILYKKAGLDDIAKREVNSLCKIIKTKPFEKLYDRWSEDKRTEIILEMDKYKLKYPQLFKNLTI